jgi:hypothetical protein
METAGKVFFCLRLYGDIYSEKFEWKCERLWWGRSHACPRMTYEMLFVCQRLQFNMDFLVCLFAIKNELLKLWTIFRYLDEGSVHIKLCTLVGQQTRRKSTSIFELIPTDLSQSGASQEFISELLPTADLYVVSLITTLQCTKVTWDWMEWVLNYWEG